jgi:uncharacterized protein (TIGR00156 family)
MQMKGSSMPSAPRALFPIVAALILAAPAVAQFSGPGQGSVTTVAEALEARDDTPFDITGNIVEQIRDDYFIFEDATGTMVAEIERRQFRNQPVTPETTVRITGEVDRSLRGRELDVDRLEIVE